jgi:cytochrome c oxidase subunit 2
MTQAAIHSWSARVGATIAGVATLLTSAAAFAAAGYADPGQMGMQDAVTPVAHDIHTLHNAILMPIITIITLFVAALLGYVMLKLQRQGQPDPVEDDAPHRLEVAWTVIPVMILVVDRGPVLPPADQSARRFRPPTSP